MGDEQPPQHEQVQVAEPEQPQGKWGDPISEERQARPGGGRFERKLA
jgi:hypothetical protein